MGLIEGAEQDFSVLKLAPRALFWPENSWLDSHEFNAHVCSLDKINGSPMGKGQRGTARPTEGGWGLVLPAEELTG